MSHPFREEALLRICQVLGICQVRLPETYHRTVKVFENVATDCLDSDTTLCCEVNNQGSHITQIYLNPNSALSFRKRGAGGESSVKGTAEPDHLVFGAGLSLPFIHPTDDKSSRVAFMNENSSVGEVSPVFLLPPDMTLNTTVV